MTTLRIRKTASLSAYMKTIRPAIIKNKFFFVFACIVFLHSCKEKDRFWSMYKADAASSSYSGLTQINKQNVSALKLAWAFLPDDAAEGTRFNGSQCNPIIVDDVMYTASARHRIYSIDASTGKKLWDFDPYDGGRGGGSFRGVTY